MKRALTGGIVMVALVLGLLGGVYWASAQSSTTAGVPITLHGWVQAIGDSTITLEGYDATTVVTLSDATLIGNKQGEEGRALLKVGAPVWIRGHLTQDGSVIAYIIRPVNVHKFPRHHVAGIVTVVGANDLLVETPEWEVKVVVTDSTRIVVPGNAQASLNDIQVGNTVTVLGKWQEHVFNARAIIVTPPVHRPVAVSGFLVDKGNDRLVLETERDEVNVLLTEQTKIRLKNIPNATVDDLKIGMRLTALGEWTDSHVLQARVITDVHLLNQLRRPEGRQRLKEWANRVRRGRPQRPPQDDVMPLPAP